MIADRISDFTVSALYCPPKHRIKEEEFGKSTYWPNDKNKMPDTIDFFVTKGMGKQNISCNSCLDLSSDHTPIIMELYTSAKARENKCILHNKRTNCLLFKDLVSKDFIQPIRLQSKSDVVEAVEFLNNSVQNAAWSSTPINDCLRPEQCVGKNIIEKINEKRKLRKQWQQTRSPDLKKLLNHITRELKGMIQQDRNDKFQSNLAGLDNKASSNYSLWKATKN